MTPSVTIEIPNDLWAHVGRSGYFFDPHRRSTRVDARIHRHRAGAAAKHVVGLVQTTRGPDRQRLRAFAKVLEAIEDGRR